jgi:hypothetical protein
MMADSACKIPVICYPQRVPNVPSFQNEEHKMSGQKSLTCRTLFPLVAIPLSQQTRTYRAAKRKGSVYQVPVPKPLYASEAEVIAAICAGTFKGFSNQAIADARRYEVYVKSLN